ncbi:hypothetical protein, partial [Paramuribaculum intestinale]|uniref:hypothetical protein n=1 Tax=Paramuribaculum intestinale TaxID=2094151 RepID=UPI00272A75C5
VASRKRVQSYTQKSSPPNFSQRKLYHQNQLLQQTIAIQHHITSKKNLKKNATSVVDPILPAGYRHIPAKFVTLNPRSKTRGEDSPLLFI